MFTYILAAVNLPEPPHHKKNTIQTGMYRVGLNGREGGMAQETRAYEHGRRSAAHTRATLTTFPSESSNPFWVLKVL
jgi:hypothetical protein